MASPASIKKHPIHPMLVALPIGLWIFALVCDVLRAAGGSANWATVAMYCSAAGIVGAHVNAEFDADATSQLRSSSFFLCFSA